MRRLLVWVFVTVVLAGGVSAQDEPPRLRVPTAEEYLQTLITLDYDAFDAEIMSPLLIEEINQRYSAELPYLPYALLSASFATLYPGSAGGYFHPYQDRWEIARILSWFRENGIDLAQYSTLRFDDYDIVITPADFNGDGNSEFILDVVRGCFDQLPCPRHAYSWADYQGFLVVVDNGDEYKIVSTPLGWLTSGGYHYSAQQSGLMQHIGVEDLSGDGAPEWLIAQASGGDDGATVHLYILSWHEGELIDLAPPDLSQIIMFSGGPPDISDWSAFEIRLKAKPVARHVISEPTPALNVPATPIFRLESYLVSDALYDFYLQEYQAVLYGIDQVLNEFPEMASSSSAVESLYLRALALEGLGREDEAAAQYAAIAADETYPDWAALAALHLESNEGR